MMETETSHWRDSALEPKLFIFNAMVVPFLLLLLMQWSLTNLMLLIGAMATSLALEYIGMRPRVFVRYIKRKALGRTKPALNSRRFSIYR